MGRRKDESEDQWEFFELDADTLDEALFSQPKLMFKYGKKKALAEKAVNEAKSDLKLVTAELDEEIRSDAAESKKKVTDKSVEQSIIRHDRHVGAVAELNQALYNLGIMEAAVSALTDRKNSLQKLVDLFGMSYFSSVRTDNDTAARLSEKSSDRVKGVRKRD